MMNVVIAGAGSIGLLLGSFLAEAGMAVTFFVRREEQAALIQHRGIQRINQDATTSTYHVEATTDIACLPTPSLWIVAVKFTGMRDLLSEMQQAKVDNPMLFVQNGLAHLELVQNAAMPHVAFATVEHGARRVDDRSVSHNGVGRLTIAPAWGDSHLFEKVGQAHSAVFPVGYHDDAEQILMRKVFINCMINPLTAILQMKNGELLTNTHSRELFDTLFSELMTAFPEMLTVLPYEAVAEVCRKTANNQSSMLTDRLAGRPMEIETIVTAIIRKANERNQSVQLLTMLETMLYAIDGAREE
ncbi:ketopantoate reductase family protein [Sporosarcina sp. NPDC096371]|uniref:ketopantoate reductase family protein n=1 Tax=Sporosarcina sp. NPDC096371 TaxID=3364530 RepID=UPI00382F88B3